MHLEAAIVLRVCCVSGCQLTSCDNTIHDNHASPAQNIGIIEVSNRGKYAKVYCLFMIKKEN